VSGILSFDLSLTRTGFALGESGRVTGCGLLSGKHDGVRRLIYLRSLVCDKVDATKPDLVVFEDLSYGSHDTNLERAGLAYMLRAELVDDGIPYLLCSPMSLKKFVCGTAGSAKAPVRKEHMLKFLATKFGHDVNDNNVADAIGLAYVGMAYVGEWEPQTVAQRDVLAKLKSKSLLPPKKESEEGWN
jgi:Holliday junction resolvasome RuvABC endonuclease subunit